MESIIKYSTENNGSSRYKNSENLYNSLYQLPEIGPFTAYQICVDVGYYNSNYFDEQKFVVCGTES